MNKVINYKGFTIEDDKANENWIIQDSRNDTVMRVTSSMTKHIKMNYATGEEFKRQSQHLIITLPQVGATLSITRNSGIVKAMRWAVDNLERLYKDAVEVLKDEARNDGHSESAIMDAMHPNRYNVDNSTLGQAKRLARLVNKG
jgi:hypothetical protein